MKKLYFPSLLLFLWLFVCFQNELVVPFTMPCSDWEKTYGKVSGVKYSCDSVKSTTIIFSS